MKKVAFLDFGYDETALGVSVWMMGLYELLSQNYEVEFFYFFDECMKFAKKDKSNFVKDLKFTRVDDSSKEKLNSYDYIFFQCQGNNSQNIVKKDPNKAKIVFNFLNDLRKPIKIYVNHDRDKKLMDRGGAKQSAICCDYILNYFPKLLQKEFDIPSDHLLPHTFIPAWRKFDTSSISLIPFKERTIDIGFMTTLSNYKLTRDYFNVCKYLHDLDDKLNFEMYGFTGFVNEIDFKNHKYVERHILESGVVEKNSDEAFIKLFKKKYNTNDVINTHANFKFSWCAMQFSASKVTKNINKKIDEILRYDDFYNSQTLEGATITSIICNTIPIVSSFWKDVKLYNKTLEEWKFFLFYDHNNLDSFVKQMLHILNNTKVIDNMLNNLKLFKQSFLNKESLAKKLYVNLESLKKPTKKLRKDIFDDFQCDILNL
jgi:hypothetical protein